VGPTRQGPPGRERGGRGARGLGWGWAERLARRGVKGAFPFFFYFEFGFLFLFLLDPYLNMPQTQRRSSQAYASHKGKIWGFSMMQHFIDTLRFYLVEK
jgi:hypothetical protein